MEKQHVVVLPLMLEKLSEPSDEGWTASQVQGLATLAVVPDSHTIHVNLSEVINLSGNPIRLTMKGVHVHLKDTPGLRSVIGFSVRNSQWIYGGSSLLWIFQSQAGNEAR